jgi:hypothetical protein
LSISSTPSLSAITIRRNCGRFRLRWFDDLVLPWREAGKYPIYQVISQSILKRKVPDKKAVVDWPVHYVDCEIGIQGRRYLTLSLASTDQGRSCRSAKIQEPGPESPEYVGIKLAFGKNFRNQSALSAAVHLQRVVQLHSKGGCHGIRLRILQLRRHGFEEGIDDDRYLVRPPPIDRWLPYAGRFRDAFNRQVTNAHALKQSVRGAQNGSSRVLTSRTAFLALLLNHGLISLHGLLWI